MSLTYNETKNFDVLEFDAETINGEGGMLERIPQGNGKTALDGSLYIVRRDCVPQLQGDMEMEEGAVCVAGYSMAEYLVRGNGPVYAEAEE